MSELDTNSTQQLKTVLNTKSREQLYDEIVSLKGRIAERDATIKDLEDKNCELDMKLEANEECYANFEDYHRKEVNRFEEMVEKGDRCMMDVIEDQEEKLSCLGNKFDKLEKKIVQLVEEDKCQKNTIEELRKEIMVVANPSSLALEYLRVKDNAKVGLIYSHWAGESLDAERTEYDILQRSEFMSEWMVAHDEWIADNEAKAETIEDLERQISILRQEQNGNIDENA